MKANVTIRGHEISRSTARENVKGLKRQNEALRQMPDNPMRRAMINSNENLIKEYRKHGK